MTRLLGNALALVLIVYVPLTSAADCESRTGSCLQDETSLIQTKVRVELGSERDTDPSLVNQIQDLIVQRSQGDVVQGVAVKEAAHEDAAGLQGFSEEAAHDDALDIITTEEAVPTGTPYVVNGTLVASVLPNSGVDALPYPNAGTPAGDDVKTMLAALADMTNWSASPVAGANAQFAAQYVQQARKAAFDAADAAKLAAINVTRAWQYARRQMVGAIDAANQKAGADSNLANSEKAAIESWMKTWTDLATHSNASYALQLMQQMAQGPPISTAAQAAANSVLATTGRLASLPSYQTPPPPVETVVVTTTQVAETTSMMPYNSGYFTTAAPKEVIIYKTIMPNTTGVNTTNTNRNITLDVLQELENLEQMINIMNITGQQEEAVSAAVLTSTAPPSTA